MSFEVDNFALEFIQSDGSWLPLDLEQCLTEPIKQKMSHTSHRFVLYGQLISPKGKPHRLRRKWGNNGMGICVMTATELKEARQKLGLTQKQMAQALETPFRTYLEWESGRPKIPGVVDVAVKCLQKKQKVKA